MSKTVIHSSVYKLITDGFAFKREDPVILYLLVSEYLVFCFLAGFWRVFFGSVCFSYIIFRNLRGEGVAFGVTAIGESAVFGAILSPS